MRIIFLKQRKRDCFKCVIDLVKRGEKKIEYIGGIIGGKRIELNKNGREMLYVAERWVF